MIDHNLTPQGRRERRIRRSLLAVTTRSRLTVNRSNQHISAQIIGQDGKVICAFSSLALKKVKGTGVEIATQVGNKLGELAKEKNVTEVVFDRGSYRFHGRVKALAEAVRKSGINF